MPELPEVETVRRTLERNYLNKTIFKVEVLYPKMIKTSLEEFSTLLCNATISSIGRKGKYLLINFDNDYTIISHLRMEGKYILREKDEEISSHTRVIFYLQDNSKLCYDDSRCFGVMYLVKTNEVELNKELSKLGNEPFFIDNPEYLYNIFKKSKKEIKTNLLDQTIMAGLGNIYVDEVLFKSKINPYLSSNLLTLEDCEQILFYSKETLNKAIKLGGSTVSSYHPEKGIDGKFQNELLAYGKADTPCVCCNTILRKDKLNGRGTTYCPKCQNVALSIGLTGKIASGKSTVLKMFKDLGAKVFSSDEEVNNLYKEIAFKKELINLFSSQVLNDDLSISKEYIKNIIINNDAMKKKLENLVHPIIKERIIKFLQKNKCEKLLVIEVPLLFEARLSHLFDYIVGVNVTLPTQIRNLKARGSKKVNQDLTLNQNHTFDKNAHKCHYLISNDGSKEELELQVKNIYQDITK